MKTIIQVVQHLTPGGIEVMALEMMRLKKENSHMIIVSLEGTARVMLSKWPRLQDVKADLIFLDKDAGYSISTFFKLFSLFMRIRPIAVHTHHIGPLLYAGIAARVTGIKNIVHTEHDAWHLENKKRRFLERQVLKLVKPTLVADSESVKTAFEQFIPDIKANTILNGIDTEKFSPGDKTISRSELNLPEKKIIIGCAGRLEKEKGQHILLRALSLLPKSHCLALAGSGSEREELFNLMHELGLDERVFFLGHQENMVNFYRSLDVFCLPSFNEGMPLAPLEAQSCNVKSVLSDVGGCSESLCPSTGSLVPAKDAHALANAITSTLENKTITEPRQFVVKNANAEHMTNDYHTLCNAG